MISLRPTVRYMKVGLNGGGDLTHPLSVSFFVSINVFLGAYRSMDGNAHCFAFKRLLLLNQRDLTISLFIYLVFFFCYF